MNRTKWPTEEKVQDTWRYLFKNGRCNSGSHNASESECRKVLRLLISNIDQLFNDMIEYINSRVTDEALDKAESGIDVVTIGYLQTHFLPYVHAVRNSNDTSNM